MDKIKRLSFQKFFSNKKSLAYLFSIAAVLMIFINGVHLAHNMDVTMDEGTYLLKGKYFLEGKYSVYEDTGPVTNKGPFSFWVFGISQLISPGLRAGRYFSLFLLSILLLVLWKLAQRFSNVYWAAAILWLIALSTYWISLYARAMTEVLTATLITLSMFFVLGISRKTWELSLGLFLAAVTALTRQNLLPYFVFSLVFVFWQHGFKNKAFISAGVGIGFFLLVNLVYWPDMYLQMWAPYLPHFVKTMIRPFIDLPPAGDIGESVLNRSYSVIPELQVLFDAVRIYLIPVLYTFWVAIFFPWKRFSEQRFYKEILFLFVNFTFLFLLHLFAAIRQNDFLYSFPAYPGFFLPIGLLLIAASFSSLKKQANFLQTALVYFLTALNGLGLGLTLNERITNHLMTIPVPRVRDMRFLPGKTELWRLLENKFHLGQSNLELIISTAFGLIVSLSIMGIVTALWFWFLKKKGTLPLGRWLIYVTLGIALLLTPLPNFSGRASVMVCNENVLNQQEKIGQELASILSPGSLVYWEYYSPTILLYVEEINLFPIQLNYHFYKRTGGDMEDLLRANLWNEEIAEMWMLDADFILLDEEAAKRLEPIISDKYYGQYDKLEITENAVPCIDRTYLHIYKNLH